MTATTEERSRMGRRNRDRGKQVQREYARYNCAIWNVDPETHAVWTAHHPDNEYICCPGEGNHVEVKGEKEWRLPAWIREAERDAIKAATGRHTLGAGTHWWIASRYPLGQSSTYRNPYYVIAPEFHYLERCVLAYTGLDWQEVFPRTDQGLIDLRAEFVSFRKALCDYRARATSRHWRLGTWIPELELLALEEGGMPWILVLERPEDTAGWKYIHGHYVLMPACDWAVILQQGWEKRRAGDAHE